MAPKKLPASKQKKSAQNYSKNPASREHKNAQQRIRNRTERNKKHRAQLNAARRADGNYGKGGKDYSHTKGGGLVRENPATNRARNRGKK